MKRNQCHFFSKLIFFYIFLPHLNLFDRFYMHFKYNYYTSSEKSLQTQSNTHSIFPNSAHFLFPFCSLKSLVLLLQNFPSEFTDIKGSPFCLIPLLSPEKGLILSASYCVAMGLATDAFVAHQCLLF